MATQTDYFMAPGAFDADAEQLRRRKAFADLLTQQGQQPLQGQMVSGHYVAPSWTQQLARGLNTYLGAKENKAVTDEMQKLGERRRGETEATLARAMDLMRGTPEQVLQPATPNDDEGNAMPATVKPAVPGNMAAAYAELLRNPGTQALGAKGMAEMPELMAKQEERKANREWRTQERIAATQDRAAQLQQAHQLRMDMLRDQQASREAMAGEQQNFQREMVKLRQGMQQQQPYYQPVQTANGVMAFNARTGKIEPIAVNGQPVVGAQADPKLQGHIAASKASGTAAGKDAAESQIELPKVVQQGEETIKLVDDLLKSPGFKQAVGASRLMGVQMIPGTAAKDFDIRLDQLKGQQFLQAFNSLRGGGQITEVEGKKATDAISRMNAAGSEQEFTKAAREFQDVIRKGVERAKQRAGGPAKPNAPSVDDLLKQYGGL
jgi:hypothetical protein